MQTALAINDKPRRNASKPPQRVSGRLKRALDLMVWGDGERLYLKDNEAAVKTGMNVKSIRWALQQPHVLAYYKRQREVLRDRECAANIHRLVEIRDAADNMPAVNAIKTLEQLGEDQAQRGQSGASTSPGVTIRIVQVVQLAPAPSASFSDKLSRANEINDLIADVADVTSLSNPPAMAAPEISAARGRGEK